MPTPPFWALAGRWAHFVHHPDLVFTHFDALDQGAYQFAAQRPVGAVEALLHAAGKLVQLPDHEPQCFFLSGVIGGLLGRGFELRQTPSGRLDPRLELVFLEHPILVGIDQTSDPTLAALDQRGQLFAHARIIPVLVVQPPLVLMLDPIRIGQQIPHIVPHRALQPIGPDLPIAAHALTTEAIGIAADATIIGIIAAPPPARFEAHRLAVERVATALADHSPCSKWRAPRALWRQRLWFSVSCSWTTANKASSMIAGTAIEV